MDNSQSGNNLEADDEITGSQSQENNENSEPEGSNSQQGGKKAPVWKHFRLVVDEDGITYAHCIHAPCQVKYKMSGRSNASTGNMIRHMSRNHPEILLLETIPQLEPFVFSQETFRHCLLKWVILCDQPFNAPQQQAFVEMIHSLNPNATTISDKTVKADVLLEYQKLLNELKNEVGEIPGKISLTLDGWTSKNSIPFLAIRGHWLDADWNLKSKLFDFAYIDGEHSGENYSKILTECLDRLGIPFAKIQAITTDNASNNDTLFDWLEASGVSTVTAQVRCLAHVLNLAAQDLLAALRVPSDYDTSEEEALEDEELPDIDLNEEITDVESDDEDSGSSNGGIIVKMRKLVRKIRKSTKLRCKLNKLCSFNNVKYLVPIIDVTTHWNSSNHMILRAEHLNVPLQQLCLKEKKLRHLLITSEDWDELNRIQGLLGKFDRATKLISMARHPTISSYLPVLDWLITRLRDYVAENSGSLAYAADQALTKLTKYELDVKVSILPFIATFLNPALKLNYFKEQDKNSTSGIREIQRSLATYFEAEYVNKTPSSTKRKRDNNEEEDEDSDDDFRSFMNKRTKVEKNSKEMNKYLNLPLSNQKVKILDYWKTQNAEFPFLTQMARDILPVQTGSVSVERDFSGAVDVITPTRCSLKHNSIRATMCVKSWLKSQLPS